MHLKYLLETPGNLLEFCFHDLLESVEFCLPSLFCEPRMGCNASDLFVDSGDI